MFVEMLVFYLLICKVKSNADLFIFKYRNILGASQDYASVGSGLNRFTNCFYSSIYPSNSHWASIMCSNSNILTGTGRYSKEDAVSVVKLITDQ